MKSKTETKKPVQVIPESKIKNVLTEEQKLEIQEAFELYDTESLGTVDVNQLKFAIKAVGFDTQNENIKRIIQEIEKNSSEYLKYDDFVELLTQKGVEKEPMFNLKRAFHQLCEPGHDKITVNSLKNIIKELGESITDEEINEMIEEADKDNDGEVGEEDFERLIKKANLI